MVKKFYVRGKHQKAVRCGGEISGGVYVILALQAAYNMELNFQTGIKTMRKGFTLIELLVVVLIIGILASVALPQYFKSVEKSRSAEAIEFIRAVMSAQERYWMKTGSYYQSSGFELDMTGLDIDFPVKEGGVTDNYVMYGYTTYFGIGNISRETIILVRKDSVPFYGHYMLTVNFDPESSPYRIVSKSCIGKRGNECNFLDALN